MNIILAFLILLLVITIHEWGHFIAARMTGVKVYEFAIGFGPILYSKISRGTKFSVRLLPLGGFCSFDNIEEKESDETIDSFSDYKENNKNDFDDDKNVVELPDATFLKKVFIVLNGIIMNFILAIVLYTCIFSFIGSQTMEVRSVEQHSKAYEVGILEGDEIISINAHKVNNLSDLTNDKDFLSEDGFTLTINREGTVQELQVPSLKDDKVLGVTFKTKKSLLLAFKSTFELIGNMISEIIKIFSRIFVHVDKGMMGIVGFVGFMSKQPEVNLIFILMLIAGISVSVGTFNLLPIIPLDGGQAVIYIIEKIIGRNISDKVKSTITILGMAFMLYLFIRVTYNDIGSL